MDMQGSAGRTGLGVKEARWYGMTARRGTVLAGSFSIMVTHLYLIFERKHLALVNCTEPALASRGIQDVFSRFIICWSLAIMVLLALVTLAVSTFLLYSVYAQVYRGLLLYIFWITCFEAVNLAVQILTDSFSSGAIRAMRWFCFLSRTVTHCFWLSFVVTYARLSYKSQQQGDILSYRRRGSTATRKSQW
ncbi:PREDICTED: transmembrane protein 217 [Chinchilla lanigera]|uniref:transmembrane protein 217 n=1 Tax=Chinchilla lanigera TaxID=34839 RepID=UPI00038EAAB2|nr:PREDICTED: transmembrane protein 217 [Chinchilla lanigera]